uniref:Uncharacterized protein n=1 Tax=viral metagenome TaxID=1070528 RepID=A0A6C0H4T9_9ZZZZ
MSETLKKKRNIGTKKSFLDTKVVLANMFDGKHRDISSKIFRTYAASKIQTDAKTMIKRKHYIADLVNFYTMLIQLSSILKRPNPTLISMINKKNNILEIFPPDRTIDDFLKVSNLYQELEVLKNMLAINFPPENQEERTIIVGQIELVTDKMYKPLNKIPGTNLQPLVRRNNAFYIPAPLLAQGRKKTKRRTTKQRKHRKSRNSRK